MSVKLVIFVGPTMTMNFLVSVKLRFIFIIIYKVEILYITKTFIIIEERHLTVCHWRKGTVSQVKGKLLITMQNDLVFLTTAFFLGLKNTLLWGNLILCNFFYLEI